VPDGGDPSGAAMGKLTASNPANVANFAWTTARGAPVSVRFCFVIYLKAWNFKRIMPRVQRLSAIDLETASVK
jgi:hypothetical protein